jgi:hypothetical protein
MNGTAFHRTSNCWIVLALLFAILPVGLPALHRSAASGKETAAYAFMRNGDLWLHYKGEARALTTKGDYTDFAVNSDGSYLALLRTVQRQRSSASRLPLRPTGSVELPEVV